LQHLEGNQAVVLEIPSEIDRGHSAAAELALEREAVVHGMSQRLRRDGHGVLVS